MDLVRQCIASGELSRYEISKRTGIDQTTLFRIVKGGSCKAENAEAILNLFGYEIHKKKRGAK